jgi:hypothetical protein
MVVARSARETFTYVLLCDRALPPEKQSVFTLRRLSTRTMMALENLQSIDLGGTNKVTVRLGDQRTVILRAGLCAWTNFNTANGQPAEFKSDAGVRMVHGVEIDRPASQSTVDLLEPEHAKELVDAIVAGNTVTPDDVGN